jgi:hypothetical protein
MHYSKNILISIFILLQISLQAQYSIKEYYKQFPYKFNKQFPFKNGNENFEIYQDTVCNEKNAYLHIESKPNDTWSDYTTFTYFRTASSNKIFVCEAGFSTTASDEYRTVFYANDNNCWKDITSKVFPYSLTFKDFWVGEKLPPKKFHKFETHIEIPSKGMYLIVHIIAISEVDKDQLHLNEKEIEIYNKYFGINKNLYFKDIFYEWDAKKGIFVKKR